MTYSTDTTDLIGLHGQFNNAQHISDTPERVAFGVYQRPVLEGVNANHIRQVMGDNSSVADTIRQQSPTAVASDPIEALVNSHPVWSVDVPDTIIHLDIASIWRTTWDRVLRYETSTDSDDRTCVDSVSLLDTFDAPSPVTDNPQFAFHYIDGQDMHLKTKLIGMTSAPSYRAALHEFSNEYTPFRCPSNWEFELVEIANTYEYNRDSFDLPHAE